MAEGARVGLGTGVGVFGAIVGTTVGGGSDAVGAGRGALLDVWGEVSIGTAVGAADGEAGC